MKTGSETDGTPSANDLMSILGRISDGVVALDRDWKYTYVNHAAATMLQRQTPYDLIGKHIWTEFPEGVGQPFQLAYETAFEKQELVVLEEYFEPWDRWFENRIYPSADGLTIYFSETTNRVKSNMASRQAAAVFSNTKDSVVIVDTRGAITNVNPAFVQVTGFSKSEIIGQSIELLFDGIEGNPLWKDVNAAKSWSGFINSRKEDGREFPIYVAKERLTDTAGTFEGSILIASDLTEAKDREKAEKQLAQAQKMEAIGELTGGIAHDFNNLLAVIMGNLELFREELKNPGVDPAELDGLIEAALDATARGADLTQNMLSFARRAALHPQKMDLNSVVGKARNWIGRTLPENIALETSLLAGLWSVEADEVSTQSALLNLILNARDAMPDGGKLTIETSNVRIDDDYIQNRGETIAVGRYVMLAVSDTGTGIPPDVQAHVFEPFFTTKKPGAGSGLGLSMVQGFLSQSGGTVQVYSEPNVGTTIKLYFKAISGLGIQTDHAGGNARAATSRSSGLRVLVVEDEAAVLTILRSVLMKAGYDVTIAASGDEAKFIFERDPSFDLLLTDIVMPGRLQGTSLARELREIRSDLPVIFMSGYASEATVHGNGLRPEDIRLMKPVRQRDLIAAIEKATA